MPNFQITNDALIVTIGETPDFSVELLKVKRLPGRGYDGEGHWIVPILPGLARALETVYGEELGGELAALIEEKEKALLSALEAREQIDIWNMPARDAANIAITHHLYTAHRGDRGEYARVHYPFILGE